MEGRKREMLGSFFFSLCLGQSLFIKLAGGEFLLSSLFHSIRWALERIFDPFLHFFLPSQLVSYSPCNWAVAFIIY